MNSNNKNWSERISAKNAEIPLSDETMQNLYAAAQSGNLNSFKALLPSYDQAMQGKLLSYRYGNTRQKLYYQWNDLLTLGQNDGVLEKSTPAERLMIYRSAQNIIDQFANNHPSTDDQLIAAYQYVQLAYNVYSSQLGNTIEDIEFARNQLEKATEIYETHKDNMMPLTAIQPDGSVILPEEVEEKGTDTLKRYLTNKILANNISQLYSQSNQSADELERLMHSADYYFAKSLLAQPKELLFMEEGIAPINAQREKILYGSKYDISLIINGTTKKLGREKGVFELSYEKPVVKYILEGNKSPITDFAPEDEHKGKYVQILNQKKLLDHIAKISTHDPIAQMNIAGAIASITESLTTQDAEYYKTAKKWFHEAIDMFNKQPAEHRNSGEGINNAFRIAASASNFYRFQDKSFTSNQSLINIMNSARRVFKTDPADEHFILGRLNGPTMLLQNIARILIKEEQYEHAIPLLEKSIRDNRNVVDPGSVRNEAKKDYPVYDLLGHCYNRTKQFDKAISLFGKMRNYYLRELVSKEQYKNNQLNLVEDIKKIYDHDMTPPPATVIGTKDQQKRLEERLDLGDYNENKNIALVKSVGLLVPISRKMIKLYLDAGKPDLAKEEYQKINQLVNVIDQKVREANIDFNPRYLQQFKYEILRSSRYLADYDIIADEKTLVKVKASPSADPNNLSIPDQLANASYIEKHIVSDQQRAVIRKLFQDLWSEQELRPVLRAAVKGIDGKLRGKGHFGIVFSMEGHPGAHGFYNNKEIVQISMKPYTLGEGVHHLDKRNIPNIKNTLIHEMTHYITNRVYNNHSSPYPENDPESKENFRKKLYTDIKKAREHIKTYQQDTSANAEKAQEDGILQHLIYKDIAEGHNYYSKEHRDSEYIVRIPAALSTVSDYVKKNGTAGYLVKEAIPNAYDHFINVFNQDIENMLKDTGRNIEITKSDPEQNLQKFTSNSESQPIGIHSQKIRDSQNAHNNKQTVSLN